MLLDLLCPTPTPGRDVGAANVGKLRWLKYIVPKVRLKNSLSLCSIFSVVMFQINGDQPRIIDEKKIKSLRARANLSRTPAEKAADKLILTFGTSRSFLIHFFAFSIWMVINSGFIPGLTVYDPYPFNFMTSVVSLEAIFLAIFVLISQNRQTDIADLREEIDLQINLQSEAEITKILKMMSEVQEHLGIKASEDKELRSMERKLNPERIKQELEREIEA